MTKHFFKNRFERQEVIFAVDFFALDFELLLVFSLDVDYHVENGQQGYKSVIFWDWLFGILRYVGAWGGRFLKITENLALVLEVVGANVDGGFVFDLSIENLGVSKNNEALALDFTFVPFGETEDIFIVDHDAYDREGELPSPWGCPSRVWPWYLAFLKSIISVI